MESTFGAENDGAGICVIRARGDVDMESAPRLEAAIEQAVASNPKSVLIDLSDVTFLDSSGIRSLVVGKRRIEEMGATLTIDGMTPAVQRVFEISGVIDLLANQDDDE